MKPIVEFEKLQKAAKHGDAETQFNLGNMYYYGEGGLKKNKAEAVKWFRKATEQGYADAQYRLKKLGYTW